MADPPPSASAPLSRWPAALGNIEDARVRAATLAAALDGALWLDDDALEAAAPAAATARTIQAQNHRLTVLKAELDAERARADAAEAAAADARGDAANARAALEAHVAELLARTEEVAALKEAVAALGGGGGGRESGGGDGGGDALPAAPRSDTRAAAHARRMEDAAKDIEVNRLAAAMLAEAEEEAEGSEF